MIQQSGWGVMQSEPRYNCAEHQHKKWEEKRGPVRETEREQKAEDSFETVVSGKAGRGGAQEIGCAPPCQGLQRGKQELP